MLKYHRVKIDGFGSPVSVTWYGKLSLIFLHSKKCGLSFRVGILKKWLVGSGGFLAIVLITSKSFELSLPIFCVALCNKDECYKGYTTLHYVG